MKTVYAAVVILLLTIGFLIGIFSKDLILTGSAIEEDSKNYSWTKAICNENKECIDVLIKCEDGKVVSLTPVSNLVQHEVNWTDSRKQFFNEFCK